MVWVVPTFDSAARRAFGNEQQIVAVSKHICNRCILVLCLTRFVEGHHGGSQSAVSCGCSPDPPPRRGTNNASRCRDHCHAASQYRSYRWRHPSALRRARHPSCRRHVVDGLAAPFCAGRALSALRLRCGLSLIPQQALKWVLHYSMVAASEAASVTADRLRR
jgi:hypothetical protein